MRETFLFLFHIVFHCHGEPSEGCSEPLPILPQPGSQQRFSILVEDPNLGPVTREIALHLPAKYDPSNRVPVAMVLDYHGWMGTTEDQMTNYGWREVADMDQEGFIFVALQGMSDVEGGGSWGSWNVSRTNGPIGLTCVTGDHSDYPVYTSCGSYDMENSCDWTSCHDDVVFTEMVLRQVTARFCVELDSIHMSGNSNGGMFIYTRAMESFSARLASVGPVCAAPLRGFNPMPESPINIIDMHGLADYTIPYSPNFPGNLPAGPDGTTVSTDGYYYHAKMDHLHAIMRTMNCSTESHPYPTHMDGVQAWTCSRWGGCEEGKEVVHCHGDYGHDYPFDTAYIQGIKILWQFMKTHSQEETTAWTSSF